VGYTARPELTTTEHDYMIDYLFKATDESTLIASLPQFYSDGWRSDISFPCQVTDNTDPNNPVILTDFHLWLSQPTLDSELTSNPTCILAADREAALVGNSFILYTTMTPQQMDVYSISPVILGSNYPFGTV